MQMMLTSEQQELISCINGYRLGEAPASMLTQANLCVRTELLGMTPFHLAAQTGQLGLIPGLLLGQNLGLEDQCGRTVAHVAATAGCLYQLPQDMLTEELMFRYAGGTGYFPVGCAALHGFLKQVPTRLLTQQNLRYECPSTGWNLLHFAAKGRSLKQVPQDLLTDSNLRQLNPRCGSVLHVAASAGCLDQVPSDVLHYENLLLPDEKGATPASLAVKHGNMDQIPEAVIMECVRRTHGKRTLASSLRSMAIWRLIERSEPDLAQHILARQAEA